MKPKLKPEKPVHSRELLELPGWPVTKALEAVLGDQYSVDDLHVFEYPNQVVVILTGPISSWANPWPSKLRPWLHTNQSSVDFLLGKTGIAWKTDW